MPYLWNKPVKKISVNEKVFHCKLCDQTITTSAIKCIKCSCYLHAKCFDKVAEIFEVEKNDWICRNCYHQDARNFELITLMNHNECLREQVQILMKLVSEQDYINSLHKQRIQELEESVSKIIFYRLPSGN